jgi:hypothetical protein
VGCSVALTRLLWEQLSRVELPVPQPSPRGSMEERFPPKEEIAGSIPAGESIISDGVTGNTTGFEPVESSFEPRSENHARRSRVADRRTFNAYQSGFEPLAGHHVFRSLRSER